MKAPESGAGAGGGFLRSWIEECEPPVPIAFRPWLRPQPGSEGGARFSVEALLNAAEAALDRSIRIGDDPREGAFDLLAADAFLTWAAEVALESDDPRTTLVEMVARVAGTARDGLALEGR